MIFISPGEPSVVSLLVCVETSVWEFPPTLYYVAVDKYPVCTSLELGMLLKNAAL